MGKSISSKKFSFLKGGAIHEAIGSAQEDLHSILQRIPSIVMKFDLAKAYHRCSWLYLQFLLIHIGFDVWAINWIMGCINIIGVVGCIFDFCLFTLGLMFGQ